jgi:DNA polymerase-3 subunit gamma/tau
MAQSLAVKYRPQNLKDVSGQQCIIDILNQQIETNNIKSCYMFCGNSGCGKTTTARIFARMINKGRGQAIEFDAASNSSVDAVKNIIEASSTKSITSEYRIYIIDECHSLSSTAWQAWLKTLEEPNGKTIFIFCTTDPEKVPQTILNRVQRFDFAKIPQELILERLQYICDQEKFNAELDALKYIVKLSKGRMRDAIAYLEKVASLTNDITLEKSVVALGETNYQIMFNLINNIIDRNEAGVLEVVNNLDNKGKDLKLFINEYTSFILDVNKFIILKDFNNINIPKVYEKELMYILNLEGYKEFYQKVLDELMKLKEQVRFESEVRTVLEITLLFLCR